MKVLRSKELLSDCLFDRTFQIKEKEKRKEDLKIESAAHHQVILKTVKTLEEIEKAKENALAERVKQVALVRDEQLRDVRARHAAEIQEQRDIGEAMKRAAQEQVEQERQNQIEKMRRTKEKNLEFKKGNDQLKEIRDQLKMQEQRDLERREEEAEIIENRKKVRKALEIRKFEKAQETRIKMIEKATKLLSERTNNDNALLNRQVDELREKEDKKFADKEAHRENEWQKTIDSRNQQVQAKKEARAAEREQERLMIQRWKIHSDEALAKEKDKEEKARDSVARTKEMQLAQGLERKKEIEESKLVDSERERLYREQGDDEDARFKEICKQEIKRYHADGKPLYPLYRAMDYKQPDLLPVSGFRI